MELLPLPPLIPDLAVANFGFPLFLEANPLDFAVLLVLLLLRPILIGPVGLGVAKVWAVLDPVASASELDGQTNDVGG